jgi:epoxyqueuosine reductase
LKTSVFSQAIKAESERLGFAACGIARARALEEEREHFSRWLSEGKQADMAYMERNSDKRLDPRLLLDDAKSLIVLLHAYYPKKLQENKDAPVVSKYAYGEDYHFVLKDKMRKLAEFIKAEKPDSKMRIFTDSAPVAEKKWAQLAGLGWIGKNSNLLTRKGSFFFISEIIIDRELEYEEPYINNHCGTCTLCIDACPTQAIHPPYSVDSGKCISYLTIEHRGEIPEEFSGKLKNRVFGCDICQDVCPFNKKPIITEEKRFSPHPELLGMSRKDWQELSPNRFSELFKKSAVKRTKYKGLKRNTDFLDKD